MSRFLFPSRSFYRLDFAQSITFGLVFSGLVALGGVIAAIGLRVEGAFTVAETLATAFAGLWWGVGNFMRALGSWTLDGRHMDANATRLLWSVDGGPWQARDTAATWKLRLDGLDGDHTVRLRSEGLERASPDVSLPIAAPGLFDSVGGGRSSPAPSFLPLLAIAFVLTLRRCLP